jgi:hypothetical protein
MKKLLIATALVGLIGVQSSFAAVAISFGMGNMYSSTNTATPFNLNGRINLLSLDTGTWTGTFPDLVSTFSSLTNTWTPAGSTLLGAIANDDSGGPGSTSGVFSFNLSGGVGAGDELLIVAYPALTTNSTQPGLAAKGFFFRTTLIVDGSDIAYVIPSDGAGVNLFSYTTDAGGTFATSQFTSGAGAAAGSGAGFTGGGFTTVPEPSTYALLAMSGLALGGYIVRRRNRA